MKICPYKLRKHALKMIYEKKSGHIGGSFSIAEVVAYLYSNFNLCSNDIFSDKLILSKGHAVPIIYAALYELGIINDFDLTLFREINSKLQGHPVKEKLSFLHATTGSLGQGLSISIGHSLALKMQNKNNKVFCILGDGEIQEGQIWEGFMFGPKYKIDNLIVFVDINKWQSDGLTKDILDIENMNKKVESFGWNVERIDGNNTDEIKMSINKCFSIKEKPSCILLDTIKGKGVSFLENTNCHSVILTEQEYIKALKEIEDACNS